jgi:hypothetical protein
MTKTKKTVRCRRETCAFRLQTPHPDLPKTWQRERVITHQGLPKSEISMKNGDPKKPPSSAKKRSNIGQIWDDFLRHPNLGGSNHCFSLHFSRLLQPWKGWQVSATPRRHPCSNYFKIWGWDKPYYHYICGNNDPVSIYFRVPRVPGFWPRTICQNGKWHGKWHIFSFSENPVP